MAPSVCPTNSLPRIEAEISGWSRSLIGYLGRRHEWEDDTAKSACQRGLIGAAPNVKVPAQARGGLKFRKIYCSA